MLKGFTSFRAIVAAVSMATIVLLPAWARVIDLPQQYVSWWSLWELVKGTLGIALLLLVLALTGRRIGWRGDLALLALVFLLTCFWGVNLAVWLQQMLSPGTDFETLLDRLTAFPMIMLGSIVLLLTAFVSARREFFAKNAMRFLSLLWPLPLILFAQVAWQLAVRAPMHTVTYADQNPKAQVIWLLFDELDQDALEKNLASLPAFRSLKDQSLWSTHAYAPGEHTVKSVPALWTGQPVDDARTSPDRLLIDPAGHESWSHTWLEGRTVFHALAAAGRRSSVTGWYFPYCKLFGSMATEGCADTSEFSAPGRHVSLFTWYAGESWLVVYLHERYLAGLYDDLNRFYASWPTMRFYWDRGRHHGEMYAELRLALLGAIKNPVGGLIYAHVNCPHIPALIPSGSNSSPDRDYRENLIVCDRLLGEIMDTMAANGEREPRMLIVSSDHGDRWRPAIEHGSMKYFAAVAGRVPFAVLLNRPYDGKEPYQRPINTLRTRDLVEEFLAGHIQSYQELRITMNKWSDKPHSR